MFKLRTFPQTSTNKLPIFDKSLATFNFEDINGLKEIGELYKYYPEFVKPYEK